MSNRASDTALPPEVKDLDALRRAVWNDVKDAYPGYDIVIDAMREALEQASGGKGKERHATCRGVEYPIDQQPITTIGRMAGVGYNVGQAMKKAHEALELPQDRAVAELLGAIVYLSVAVKLKKEGVQ